MTGTRTELLLPDLAFIADGGELVRQIEAYLASRPAPPAAIPVPVVHVNPWGSSTPVWDADMPRRVRTVGDRLRGRAARPVPIDTATHLRLMSRYLLQQGWCQNLMWDQRGRACLLGASIAVLGAGYGTTRQAEGARGLLMEQFIGQVPGISGVDEWNDMPGRTAAQVHRQLDIATARAHHRP